MLLAITCHRRTLEDLLTQPLVDQLCDVEAMRSSFHHGELKKLDQSWKDVKVACDGQVVLKIFADLFEKYPEMKGLFGFRGETTERILKESRMIRHALVIQENIDMTIEALLHNNAHLVSLLENLGKFHYRHAKRGFTSQYFLAFYEAFMTTFIVNSQHHVKHFRFVSLWRKFFRFLTLALNNGLVKAELTEANEQKKTYLLSTVLKAPDKRTSVFKKSEGKKRKGRRFEEEEDNDRPHIGAHLLALMMMSVPGKFVGGKLQDLDEENEDQ